MDKLFKTSRIVGITFILFCIVYYTGATDKKEKSSKDITIISAQSTSDGSSEIRNELLEECIKSLPNVSDLEATLTSESKFLKAINGDLNKNDYVKVYTASLTIPYLLYQKELIIITTRSIKGQKPVMKEVEKKMQKEKSFVSDANNGDLYAGKGRRAYYFSSAELASKDVMEKAKVWLKQQQNVRCTK